MELLTTHSFHFGRHQLSAISWSPGSLFVSFITCIYIHYWCPLSTVWSNIYICSWNKRPGAWSFSFQNYSRVTLSCRLWEMTQILFQIDWGWSGWVSGVLLLYLFCSVYVGWIFTKVLIYVNALIVLVEFSLTFHFCSQHLYQSTL